MLQLYANKECTLQLAGQNWALAGRFQRFFNWENEA